MGEWELFKWWCKTSWSYMKGYSKIYVLVNIPIRYIGFRKQMIEDGWEPHK